MLAATDIGDKTVVEKIAETGAITAMLTIPDALPQSFDPSGTHLIYVAGHKPPLLTEATITNGKLTSGPWRASANVGALAW